MEDRDKGGTDTVGSIRAVELPLSPCGLVEILLRGAATSCG